MVPQARSIGSALAGPGLGEGGGKLSAAGASSLERAVARRWVVGRADLVFKGIALAAELKIDGVGPGEVLLW